MRPNRFSQVQIVPKPTEIDNVAPIRPKDHTTGAYSRLYPLYLDLDLFLGDRLQKRGEGKSGERDEMREGKKMG